MIAVTGLGAICTLGMSSSEVFSNLCLFGEAGAGRHFRAPECLSTAFREGGRVVAGVPLDDAALRDRVGLGRAGAGRFGRASLLVLHAVQEALADAGLLGRGIQPERIGVFGGTSMAGTEATERLLRQYLEEGRIRRIAPILAIGYGEIGSLVAARFGLKGPRLVVSTACSSSTTALYFARNMLLDGRIDAAVVFGGDPIAEVAMAGFSSIGAFHDGLSAPFSTGVPGISLGEGAGALVLEAAPPPGGRAYAWLGGVAVASECHHLTSPDPNGLGAREVMHAALMQAGKDPRDIQAIIAHGTGTEMNDLTESKAIRMLGATDPLVLSTKGATGHTLGGAGILNSVVACLCLQRKTFPASPRFLSPRPGVDINVPCQTVRDREFTGALANSFGFGGSVASASFFSEGSGALEAPCAWRRRVAVTGVGLVTPAGNTVDELERAILLGTRHFSDRPSGKSLTGRRDAAAAGVWDLDQDPRARNLLRKSPSSRKMDRFAMMAYLACADALKDAEYRVVGRNQARTGVFLGSAQGTRVIEQFYATVVARGPGGSNPSVFPNTVMNACLGYFTIDHLLRGPGAMVMQGEASSGLAMALAADLISRVDGGVDAMLCGGVEELSPLVVKAYLDLGLVPAGGLPDTATEPWSEQSRGFLLGEASIAFLLEDAEAALGRGAALDAEWACSVLSGAGHHAQDPLDPVVHFRPPASRAVTEALEEAKARAGTPDLLVVNVHGGPWQRKEVMEGIRASGLGGVPRYSPLRLFGNCLGSSGALGAFAAITAIRHQRLPPDDSSALSVPGLVRSVAVLTVGSDGLAQVNVLKHPRT